MANPNKKIKTQATAHHSVYVDPADVVEQINVGIPNKDWVVQKGDKYEVYTEGYRGATDYVGETTKEVFDLYVAKELLLNHLRKED